AVVAGHRDRHYIRNLEFAVLHDGPLLTLADGEDRRLGRIDDAGEMLDAVHAEIGDREASAFIFGRLQLLVAGTRGERLRLRRNFRETLLFRPADDGRDEAAVERN